MNHAAGVLPDLEALNPSELKALIVEQHKQILIHHEQLLSRDAEIEHLKLLLAKLRRMQFGRSSEKVDRQIAQLELRLGELEQSRAIEAESPKPSAASMSWHDRCGGRCLHICGGKCRPTCRHKKLARTVAGN